RPVQPALPPPVGALEPFEGLICRAAPSVCLGDAIGITWRSLSDQLIERPPGFSGATEGMLCHDDAPESIITSDLLKPRQRVGGFAIEQLNGTQLGEGTLVRRIDRERMAAGVACRAKISAGGQPIREIKPYAYRERIDVSCRSCKRDRFRQPPQTPKHSRIVLQYSRVVWVEFERLGEIRLRASPIPLPGCAPPPTCRITPRLVWCQRDRPLGRGRSSLKSRGIICYVRKKRLRKGEARVGRGVVRIERN